MGTLTTNIIRRHIINKTNARYLLVLIILFAMMALVLKLMGFDPINGLVTLLTTSFKSTYGFWGTVKKFIPLLLQAYAFAIPLKIRLFNIGGLGQMQIGGVVATLIAFTFGELPPLILIPIAIILSIIAGGLYGYIAAFLKNRYNINPVITTSMTTFMSNMIVNYVCSLDKYGELVSGFPMTYMVPENSRLPYWGTVPSWILVIPIVILVYFLIFRRSIIGYKIEATGDNPIAANAYGINSKKVIIFTFAIAGAIAGLAGAIEVLGVHTRLISGFARTSGADFGTFGSLTSLVAGDSMIGLPITAFLMAILLIGADSMQRTIQIPAEIIFLLQSVLVISIVTLRWQLERNSKK